MSEYKKHQFNDGDILFAKPLNEMSGAVEEIYNMLHAEPKLDYVDNIRKYYFDLGTERIIPIKFTTGMPGPVTIYIAKNGDYFNDFTTTQGIINVPLGVITEQETAVYEITAKDSMNQGPSNNSILQFSVITGGLQFATQFMQVFENGALTTETTNITFSFDLRYVDNSEGIRSIKSEIFLNNEPIGEPYIQEYDQNQSETYITVPISLDTGLYTIKLTGSCILNNGLDFEVYETYQFNVLQPNTATAIVISEDFGDSNYFNSLQFKIEDAYEKIMGGKNLELIAKCSIYNEQGELYNNPVYIYGYHNEIKTWDIGKITFTNDVSAMNFIYEIKIYTLDGEPVDPNYPIVRKNIEIPKGEATIGSITEGLLAYFDASSHSSNQDTNKDKWESLYSITGSGSRAYFKLNNLNFGTNDGWLKSNYFNDTILKLTGQGYGKLYTTDLGGKEIEWNPMDCLKWTSGKTEYGFTVEIMYKTSNIGNFDAQVMSCRPHNDTYNGFNFGLNSVGVSTTSNNYSVVGAEEEWQHIAIVLDKEKRSQYNEASLENFNPCPSVRFYVNGVLTKVENLEIGKNGETSTDFNQSTPLLPILLNTFPGGLENKKFGECELKLVRFYNRGLTSSDVYINYLSSLPQEKQDIVSRRNNIKTTNIPVIYFIKNPIYYENKDTTKIYKTYKDGRQPLYYSYDSFDGINRLLTADKDKSKCTYVNCTAYYCYYENGTQKIEPFYNLDVSLQGTSSLSYPVKNYKIYNYEKPSIGTTIPAGEYEEVPFVPKGISSDKNWYASSFYTLKCDYMEQSHKNNTPTALYYDKVLDGVINSLEPDSSKRQELYSPAKQNGFKDAIDGFPCLVYYNDNTNGDVTSNNFQGHVDNKYAGSYMFNIDKEGPGLGFELPEQDDLVCVSYEGGSNENISAATFVLDEDAGVTSEYEDYYELTMEPRYKYTKEKIEYKGEQLSKCYLPLIEAINALRPFNNLKTLSDITPEISTQFKTVFSQYFNVPYCITYFLQLMTFTQIDNVGKNAMFDIWGTKDPSTGEITWGKIFPRPYDMDSQMGESNSGEDKIPVYAEFSPTFSPEQGLTAEDKRFDGHYNVTESNLWIPFALVYWDSICDVYKYLRNNKHSETDQHTIYSVNGINNYVKSVTSDIIGERFYNKDAVAKYLSQYTTSSGYKDASLLTLQGNRENRYKQFLEQRLIYLDGYFGNREANLKTNTETQDQEVDIDSISSITTLNTPIIMRCSPTDPANGIMEADCDIYIQTYTPSYVYIDVDNKQKYVKYVDNTIKTDGFNGVKFTITIKGNDKNVYVFNAGNIQSINGLNNLKLTSIDLTYASKITNLNITNNSTIQRVSIRNNPLVQTIDVSDCSSLTKLNFIPSVSTHVTSLNLSNCKAFNQAITITNGNLLTLNASNSAIATLTLDTNVNFSNLNLNNCGSLTSLSLTRCNKLQGLDLVNSNLSSLNSIKIDRCEELETLTIPSSAALNSLILEHNYGLHTLNMDGCNGETFRNLNLTTLVGLKHLSLRQTTGTTSDPYVNILLPLLNNSSTNLPVWTGLLSLDLTSSSVQNIGYGVTGALTSMDLSGITTVKDGENYISGETLVLQYCNGVRKITNLNYENNNLSKLFYHCVRLKEVSGDIRTEGTTLTHLFAIDDNYESEFTNANTNTTEVLDLSDLRLTANNVTTATNWFFKRPDLGDVEETGIRSLINSMPAAEDLSGMFQIYSNKYGTFNVTLSTTNGATTEYVDFFRLNNDSNGTIKRPIKKLNYFFYGAGNALSQNITRHFFKSIQDNSLSEINNMFQGTNIRISKEDNYYPLAKQNSLTSIIGAFSGCSHLDLADALETIPSGAKITGAHNAFVSVGSSLTTHKSITGTLLKTFLAKLNKPASGNIDIHRLFYGSKGITTLPSKLFDYKNLREHLENISAMFADISTLTTIQDDMFETSTQADFEKLKYASGLFADDFSLKHNFGANFFIRTPKIEDIGARTLSTAGGGTATVLGMFSKNNTTKTKCAECNYHEELFKPLTNLNNASHLFYLNIKSSIDKTQLIGFNIKINSEGATTLSTNYIPIKLFLANSRLTNLSYAFYNTPFAGFGSVKQVNGQPILDVASIAEAESFLPTSITNINGLFQSAKKLTGAWHQSLFKNKNKLVYANYVFDGTEITGTIAEDMFKGCTAIQELTKTFYNCNKLGTTLDLQNNTFPCHILQPCANTLRFANYTFGLETKNSGDGGLHSVLKEYKDKPSLFENCVALESCTGFFYNCSNLHGAIPPNMFKGISTANSTSPLTDISYLFCNCSTLTLDQNTTYLDSRDNKRYLVPSEWLQNCPQLTKANHLFANVGFLSFSGYNYMGMSTQNIELYYQNPSNLGEGLKESITVQQYYFPKLLFSYAEPLTTVQFACNNMKYLIVELDSYFMKNNKNLTNIERIFYNTNINTLGIINDYAFKKDTDQGIDWPYLTNARYAFNSSSAMSGYAPLTSDLQKAFNNNNFTPGNGLYGIYGPNSEDIVSKLNELYKENGVLKDVYKARVQYSHELTGS